MEQEKVTERVLVVNAAYEHAALRRAFAVGRDLGATHVIFTHLDPMNPFFSLVRSLSVPRLAWVMGWVVVSNTGH